MLQKYRFTKNSYFARVIQLVHHVIFVIVGMTRVG
jgi:hypothetical protein